MLEYFAKEGDNMENYKFLEHKYLKDILFNGFINVKTTSDYGVYKILTKSYQEEDNYWVNRKKLESFLNIDSDTKLEFKNWYYIKSVNFNGIKKHRIYLHPQGKYIPAIAKLFLLKCKKRNVQFWFKFKFGEGSDKMVFYPTDEQFPIFNEIIDEIFLEYPIIKTTCLEPPISTLEYKSKVGYGKENEGINSSWTEHISIVVTNCIKYLLCRMITNIDFFKYDKQYLTKKLVEAYLNDYKEYNQKDDINEKQLYTFFQRNINTILTIIKDFNKYKDCIERNDMITYTYINGKKIPFRPTFIIQVCKTFIEDIINKYGEKNVLNTLSNFISCNLPDLKITREELRLLYLHIN